MLSRRRFIWFIALLNLTWFGVWGSENGSRMIPTSPQGLHNDPEHTKELKQVFPATRNFFKSMTEAYGKFEEAVANGTVEDVVQDMIRERLSPEALSELGDRMINLIPKNYLRIPRLGIQIAELSTQVTVEIVLDFVQSPLYAGKYPNDIMKDLVVMVKRIERGLEIFHKRQEGRITGRIIHALIPQYSDTAKVVVGQLVESHAVSRTLLPVMAAILNGFDPRRPDSPQLYAFMAAYSLGNITEERLLTYINAVLPRSIRNDPKLQVLLQPNNLTTEECAESAMIFFGDLANRAMTTPSVTKIQRHPDLDKTAKLLLRAVRLWEPGSVRRGMGRWYDTGGIWEASRPTASDWHSSSGSGFPDGWID